MRDLQIVLPSLKRIPYLINVLMPVEASNFKIFLSTPNELGPPLIKVVA